ncbi:hypothetical protein H0B56_03550 [Haloechinothrix sp. YIM 98757]|uniref:Uncharacterized protein n=1 Tax=Haloechinothrix aidingensis TaxID=2752311 RepID=A0A838A852_9PSEU|nr:hypothetical protein [Haloechinothrix aidingensis]MBA0124611.1 hypothetical protein [Haloechinothrix aidingensis]
MGDTATQRVDTRVAPGRSGPVGVHRPRRALVAVLEVLLAAGLLWAAWAAWSQGVAVMEAAPITGADGTVTRYHGNWSGFAVALATGTALFVLDAVRQVMLAVGSRRN